MFWFTWAVRRGLDNQHDGFTIGREPKSRRSGDCSEASLSPNGAGVGAEDYRFNFSSLRGWTEVASELSAQLSSQMQALSALSAPGLVTAAAAERLARLKTWQNRRLAQSFAALSADPRYAKATTFFLDDLYASADVGWRDRDVHRVLPTMNRWLPASVLATLAQALELDVLSRRFDLAVAAEMPTAEFTVADYAEAYRRVGDPVGRARQIELIRAVGSDLERVVRKPFVLGVLKLARAPARGAGFGQLQSFLERGFSAFRGIGDTGPFLQAIVEGESEVMRRLFAGHPDPFGFQLQR